MNTIYLLLGANLGSPLTQIKKATEELKEKIGSIIAASSIYESEAWGLEDQPIFFNQVLKLKTSLKPLACLQVCQQIELDLGRIRNIKWGSRVIDIDILYFNNDIIETETLKVPHPFIHLRNFTLYPLSEIAEDYLHPVLKKTNKELLLTSKDKLLVKRI